MSHRSSGARGPFVTLTYAQSLDGSLAARPGRPLALSGPEAMLLTHRLRAAHDAILVGIGTVLADNPRLTARLVPGSHPQPVVLDTHLRCPADAALFHHPTRRPWLLCGPDADPERADVLAAAGAQVIRLPLNRDGHVHLGAALAHLGELGVGTVMVEGGAQVITACLAERRAHFVVLTMAPVFVGGLRSVAGLLADDPGLLPRLHEVGSEQLGDDLILWGRLAKGNDL
ncbi:MAG: RibD family protein [Anaerolineae bacterium]|nr:RibD family protein [Anaerolineae bacterium]